MPGGIGSLIKVKPAPLNIAPPGLADIDFDPLKALQLPVMVTTRNPWLYDGRVSTCPHFSGAGEFLLDDALRPEAQTSDQVVYDVIDIRKPEFTLSLPDDHRQAGLHIKQAAFLMPFDAHTHYCNLQ